MEPVPSRCPARHYDGPVAEEVTGASDSSAEVVRRFHELYYSESTLFIEWLGVRTIKSPLDLWIYQEIICRNRPELIVEAGTGLGGSALFMACVCDLLGKGRVLTIDKRGVTRQPRPSHPRITYLTGSSVDPEIVAQVGAEAASAGDVMVILDSDHSAEHVLAELRAYAPIVAEGHYLIVEDTNINGHPVFPEHGPGPWEAVETFLADPGGRDFEIDRACERFHLTLNPGGFLRRRAAAEAS